MKKKKRTQKTNRTLKECEVEIRSLMKKIHSAMLIVENYGWAEGAHHKQWVIDQIVRRLLGKWRYKEWAKPREGYEDWNEGIAP